jgi:hypothetical protein
VPFVSAIPRAIDGGQAYLDAFTFHRGPALDAIQEVTENELGGLFYMNGAGAAVFEDRHHRWKDDHLAAVAVFTERGIVHYHERAEDRVKSVVLDYPRWTEGGLTELWHLDRVPVTIEGSGAVTFEVDFGGVARDVIKPGDGDYVANRNPDGGGPDETANVLVTVWHDWGGGAEVTLENQQTHPVFLTFLRVRGTPIRVASDRTPARYTAAGGPAIAATISHGFQLNGREADVQSWAEYLGERYSVPRERIAISLQAPFPEASVSGTDMVQVLARAPGDRVAITNNALPFSLKMVVKNYYIDRVDRRWGEENIDCDWELVPVDDAYWLLGTSILGTDTVLAP